MDTTNKCTAKKREYAIGYKFSELTTLNRLKKIFNLIDFADVQNKVSTCYQIYIKDEMQLSLA